MASAPCPEGEIVDSNNETWPSLGAVSLSQTNADLKKALCNATPHLGNKHFVIREAATTWFEAQFSDSTRDGSDFDLPVHLASFYAVAQRPPSAISGPDAVGRTWRLRNTFGADCP
jgi:hypothetical protein